MTDDRTRATLEEWMRIAYGTEAGCPPPEAFLEAERGGLKTDARKRLDRHVATCSACTAEQHLAAAFDAEPAAGGQDLDHVLSRLERMHPAPAAADVVPLGRRRPWFSTPAVWRLAAAAAVVLAAGWMFLQTRPPAVRPGGETGAVRGSEVELLEPLDDVDAVPQKLRWAPHAGADRYRVRLLTVEDSVLWEGTVAAPPALIPEEVGRRMHRAVVYFWDVEALDAEGSRLAVSKRARFRARPADDPERMP